jgi:hypothetical protein
MISSTFNSKNNYRPKKVLVGVAQQSESISSWLYNDLENDPWWQGSNAVPYKFIIDFSITPVVHGSHLTREKFQYNGLDIIPGMWVSGLGEAKALKITKVISKTPFHLKCECEDEYRYNIFKDNSGNGNACFNIPSPVVFFELGDDGIPVFDPMPPEATDLAIIGQLESRFRVFNITKKLKLFKQKHTFVESDVITIISGEYSNVTNPDQHPIGIVTDIGPSPNEFWIYPHESIIELEPGVIGPIGTFIWYDGNAMTAIPQNYPPSYIKIKEEQRNYTNYTDNSWVGSFELNGILIESTGDLMVAINAKLANHGCKVIYENGLSTITSVEVNPLSYTNTLSFSLNGIMLSSDIPSITNGINGYIGAWDVVRTINELTHLHGCYAYIDNSGVFGITYDKELYISNIYPATSSDKTKTFTDMFLFNNYYNNASPIYKVLRDDGGEIIVSEISGYSGIQSASNGKMATMLTLNIKAKTSTNYMVDTIADRNAIVNIAIGDQVYVQRAVGKEWGLFIKTQTGWVKVADENSSNTDANTFSIEVNANHLSSIIGNMSYGSRISNITFTVDIPFGTSDFKIGTAIGDSIICDGSLIDFGTIGTYTMDSSYICDTVEDQNIYFEMYGSTTGLGTLVISYL